MGTKIDVNNIHSRFKIHPDAVKKLVRAVLKAEKMRAREISVVFATDEYLRKLHRDFLKNDRYTDVITFDLSEGEGIEGEIYVSLDRARYFAREYQEPFHREVARLVIHGLLHLKGYSDATPAQRQEMHQRENQHLKNVSLNEKMVDF